MKHGKAVWGWALYDWANSAFATTVMAGFFPLFFKSYWSEGANVNASTAQLGIGNSMASLAVALMAPVLGAVADRGSARKRFLLFFAYLGVLATGSLWFVGQGQWALAILVYVIGVVGFSGANVFCDALLPAVTSPARYESVSGLGFALGYLGGGLLFLVNVLMVLAPARFGLDGPAQAVRLSFVTVALWWGAFTLFTLFWVHEGPHRLPASRAVAGVVRPAFRQLLSTLREARRHRPVLVFLLAYWLYIDGVHTIIRMAVDYGMSLGFEPNDLIVALLITQFVGFPCTLVFGRLGERWDPRKALLVGIGVYCLVTLWGVTMTTKLEFFGIAVLVGTVQGGVQALSRSTYARLIPPEQAGEFYGFYNMVGKFAAIIGPALMALTGMAVHALLAPEAATPEALTAVERLASRWSIGSVLLLFLAGGSLLTRVRVNKAWQPGQENETHAPTA